MGTNWKVIVNLAPNSESFFNCWFDFFPAWYEYFRNSHTYHFILQYTCTGPWEVLWFVLLISIIYSVFFFQFLWLIRDRAYLTWSWRNVFTFYSRVSLFSYFLAGVITYHVSLCAIRHINGLALFNFLFTLTKCLSLLALVSVVSGRFYFLYVQTRILRHLKVRNYFKKKSFFKNRKWRWSQRKKLRGHTWFIQKQSGSSDKWCVLWYLSGWSKVKLSYMSYMDYSVYCVWNCFALVQRLICWALFFIGMGFLIYPALTMLYALWVWIILFFGLPNLTWLGVLYINVMYTLIKNVLLLVAAVEALFYFWTQFVVLLIISYWSLRIIIRYTIPVLFYIYLKLTFSKFR